MAESIRGAVPKLKKMIEDEAEDQEAVGKMLEISETITADLERYDKLRKGDFQGASQVNIKPMYGQIYSTTLTSSTDSTRKPANGGPTSLIDFDSELGGSNTSTLSKQGDGTGNLLDDLAGLSFQNTPIPFGQGGSITLGHDTSIALTIS